MKIGGLRGENIALDEWEIDEKIKPGKHKSSRVFHTDENVFDLFQRLLKAQKSPLQKSCKGLSEEVVKAFSCSAILRLDKKPAAGLVDRDTGRLLEFLEVSHFRLKDGSPVDFVPASDELSQSGAEHRFD